MRFDVVVIGGGPAGMCAALKACEKGSSVAIIERDYRLGGILNQCIHNGFGLHYFKEELTGTEYASRLAKKVVENQKITLFLNTLVVLLSADRTIKAVNSSDGILHIEAGSVVLAMGCRERTAGAIKLKGARPAGIYTAGMAQKLCNTKGYLVGKKIVILGSGDIGLIMARRMTFEGAKVLSVVELMPYSSGLKRNISQCLDDFGIPVRYSHTVTRVLGERRVEGVYIAPVDEKLLPIYEREEFLPCDCLLLSVGLLPETDLVKDIGIEFSPATSGAVVDEFRQTSIEGFFSAGNVLHVHDLVDNVSLEGEIAGEGASAFAKGKSEVGKSISVFTEGLIRYALPQKIHFGEGEVKLYFRVKGVIKNATVEVVSGNKSIATKKFILLSPGEMEHILLDKSKIAGDIILRIKE